MEKDQPDVVQIDLRGELSGTSKGMYGFIKYIIPSMCVWDSLRLSLPLTWWLAPVNKSALAGSHC